MNHTASGAVAVGAPNSLARYITEAKRARDVDYNLLLLTDEGKKILNRFASSIGTCFETMLKLEKDDPGTIAEWINKHYAELFYFLCTFDLVKKLTIP